MLILLLRFLRKTNNVLKKINLKWKIFSYTKLAKGKFDIHNSLKAGKNFKIVSDLSETSIKISSEVNFRDGGILLLGHSGKLSIGRNCFFNNNCSLNCFGIIDIGNNNQFGENVLMYDHNHKYKDTDLLISQQGYSIGFINIGNNCWIGSNVVILKNVTIGDNVVIGSGSVIYKSIPSNSTVICKQELIINSKSPNCTDSLSYTHE